MPIHVRKKPVKKRVLHLSKTYHEYRAAAWERIDRTGFDARASSLNGVPLFKEQTPSYFILQPKLELTNADIWHCGSPEKAKTLLIDLLHLPDVNWCEFRGTWVWIKWSHQGRDFALPDTPTDDRETYKAV